MESLTIVKDSLYEHLHPLTTVAGQHFVSNFSRHSLDTKRWHIQQIVSTCAFAPEDSVDGGLLISTDSGSGSPSAYLSFNDICQYDPTGFRFISTCKKGSDSNVGIKAGIGSDDATANPAHLSLMTAGSLVSHRALATKDGSTASQTNSDVAVSSTEFVYDIVGNGSNNILSLDGVTKVTKTTNLPTAKCQPLLYIQSRSTAAVKTWNCKYVECFNT
jgi:hypothetical protein|tara:strand:+ start:1489 stop:2139 length:651 start_codon:yes stop_codon:yes gene_type:complete